MVIPASPAPITATCGNNQNLVCEFLVHGIHTRSFRVSSIGWSSNSKAETVFGCNGVVDVEVGIVSLSTGNTSTRMGDFSFSTSSGSAAGTGRTSAGGGMAGFNNEERGNNSKLDRQRLS